MNEQQLTIDEAKELLNQGFGSIYTKDEVMSLLDRIKKESCDLEKVFEEVQDHFEYKIRNIDFEDVLDLSSASFSIEHGNEVVLDHVIVDLEKITDYLKEVLREIKANN